MATPTKYIYYIYIQSIQPERLFNRRKLSNKSNQYSE